MSYVVAIGVGSIMVVATVVSIVLVGLYDEQALSRERRLGAMATLTVWLLLLLLILAINVRRLRRVRRARVHGSDAR